MVKEKKIVKGISLSPRIIELINKKRTEEKRSFSAQMEYIIENWAINELGKKKKEEKK